VLYDLMDFRDPHLAWAYLTNGRPGELHPDDLPMLEVPTLHHAMIPERAALRVLHVLDMVMSAESYYGAGDDRSQIQCLPAGEV
jgi:hypothetical protein